MARPLIGLPGRRRVGKQIVGFQDAFSDAPLDLYFADFASGVLEAGGLPVYLPLEADPRELAERVDGIVLPGGPDIDPVRYGRSLESDRFPFEAERDEFELALFDRAVEISQPVLGVCRGLQVVNVHGGGTLHQDVPEHARFDLDPTVEIHEVSFVEGSVLHSLYGDGVTVNSLHHQTVAELAPGYRVTATADDGTIEGIEAEEGRIIAVQWHPEMMVNRAVDPGFRWLVEQARS